jgi:hypothetical protein
MCVKGSLQFLIFVEFFFSRGKAVSELHEMNIVTAFCMCIKLRIHIVKGGQIVDVLKQNVVKHI